MGLDSHLSGRRSYWGNDRKIDEEGFYVEAVEVYLGYWRKDWALQNYVTDNFGEGNDGAGPIDLSLEDLHKILEAVPLLKDDEDDMSNTSYEETPEEKRARIFDTEEMIKRAIAFLTIDTVVPPPKMVWRTVFWHASW
jgi:hypothetical protein